MLSRPPRGILFTKLNHLNTSSPGLDSPIEDLFSKRKTKSVQGLIDSGVVSIIDLLWIFPLHMEKIPPLSSFDNMSIDNLFRGRGRVESCISRPNFRGRGKRGALLHTITVVVRDDYSSDIVILKWFNSYSSVSKKIEKLKEIEFFGRVTSYQGRLEIINPDIGEKDSQPDLQIKYPTINSVKGHNIQKIILKIPDEVWNGVPEIIPDEIIEKRKLFSRESAFKLLHGRCACGEKEWSETFVEDARNRLIYEEFFLEQIEIQSRRKKIKSKTAPEIIISDDFVIKCKNVFPFELTDDQIKVLSEIRSDMVSKIPMSRLLQGDVGCGKTAVAIVSAIWAIENGLQVAMMCPTETLTEQHFMEIKRIFEPLEINVDIILGSTKAAGKKDINQRLLDGQIQFIIGTHSLIQDSVGFKNLGLVIIDEQQKFGVDQRLKLATKVDGAHCLIMTATPIPRSLSMAVYGDLDISTIKTVPKERKGASTRIITPGKFEKFLNFLKTRLSMGEQAYVVVPAIDENEGQTFLALSKVLERFAAFYPDSIVRGIHGRMKSDEKSSIFSDFLLGKIDILVATSVIEVGINVLNATVIAIMNPERFGLSSLHQMRGRVGRGSKPGFCFLVTDRNISPESMQRLEIIEKTSDGFKIAEEDLRIRGEGDIIGTSQSGLKSYKLASIVSDQELLSMAKIDAIEISWETR